MRDVTIHQYFGPEHRDPASRNRRAMIEKVWAIWITGVLQPSLPHDILLELGLTERSAMVARVLDLYVQRPDLADQVQAPGTRLLDVFDRLDRALLILGAPGAGKTTLLLTLARDLLIRAAQDPEQPIPVVFPLSTWAQRRRSLAAWLVDALNEQYDVPRKTGQPWVDADQILPLLDGLDEVAPEHRDACGEAINTFRQEHGLLPLVVCSRLADYEILRTRLRLQGAVAVQPLTPQQVNSYLTQIGQPMAAVREALHNDPTLWELLETPLMLTVTTLAYAGASVEVLRTHGTPVERRQHLFATYVDRMFQRRIVPTRYTRPQTEHWLAWLAWQMAQHSQTVFYLERVQPDWLPRAQRWVPTQGASLVGGLLFGLVAGLLIGLVFSLRSGLLFGLGFGLLGILLGYSAEITSVETVRWAWSGFLAELLLPSGRKLVIGLGVGLFSGLVFGLAGGLFFGLGGGLGAGLVTMLGLGLGLGLSSGLDYGGLRWLIRGRELEESFALDFGFVYGLFAGLVYKLSAGLAAGLAGREIATKTRPNEGIHRSLRMALLSGLGSGLLFGLAGGLLFALAGVLLHGLPGAEILKDTASLLLMFLTYCLFAGAAIGLTTGLRYGGRACLQHLLLRLALRSNGSVPWHYVDFLDYAAERIFLHKVGGGYSFIHRLLQEYFASLYKESGDAVNRDALHRC